MIGVSFLTFIGVIYVVDFDMKDIDIDINVKKIKLIWKLMKNLKQSFPTSLMWFWFLSSVKQFLWRCIRGQCLALVSFH